MTIKEQFNDYFNLLEEWNKTFNLTAIRQRKDMETLHLQDSLSVLPYVSGKTLLDVGSGAGFPGVILAISKSDLAVTLLDSAGKKTRFLQQVKATLKLSQVTVVHSRVEDYHPEQLFDQVISRAFSDLTKFVTCTEHLCKKDGQFLAMKGQYPQAEIEALPKRFAVTAVHRLEVPGLSAERHLIIIENKE